RQGLIFPLFVLSISTLDFSSELMLLLLHIINTETPYVNLFLCGNLNNNIGYFSLQRFLKVHYTYKANHNNTLNAIYTIKIKTCCFYMYQDKKEQVQNHHKKTP